jgi:hypothetical protein
MFSRDANSAQYSKPTQCNTIQHFYSNGNLEILRLVIQKDQIMLRDLLKTTPLLYGMRVYVCECECDCIG